MNEIEVSTLFCMVEKMLREGIGLKTKDMKGTFYVKEFLAKGAAGSGYSRVLVSPKKERTGPCPRDPTCFRSNLSDGLSAVDTTTEVL